MLRNCTTVYLFTILCTLMGTPTQAATRVFVASYGSDGNSCALKSPCRLFAKAVTVVDPNGEVVALDAAGYGPVLLTQPVTLTAAPGAYAGIAISSGTGVTISAPVNVVLRGLTINSLGGGDTGILMTTGANGAKLSIENCVISNFSISGSPSLQYGVLVQTAATVQMVNTLVRDNDVGVLIQAGGATADISGSKFLGNSTNGIVVKNSINGTTTTAAISDTVVTGGGDIGIYAVVGPASTAIARITLDRSVVSNYGEGVVAESDVGTASVSIRKSMVTESSLYGLVQLGSSSTLTSYGNNTLSNNATNKFGTVTPAAPL